MLNDYGDKAAEQKFKSLHRERGIGAVGEYGKMYSSIAEEPFTPQWQGCSLTSLDGDFTNTSNYYNAADLLKQK